MLSCMILMTSTNWSRQRRKAPTSGREPRSRRRIISHPRNRRLAKRTSPRAGSSSLISCRTRKEKVTTFIRKNKPK